MKHVNFACLVFSLIASGAIAKIRGHSERSSCLCQILQAHATKESGHLDYLVCDLILEQEGYVAFGLHIDLPESVVLANKEALHHGEWFINITDATVETINIEGHGIRRTAINVFSISTITTISPDDGRLALLSARQVRRVEQASIEGRHLQTMGTHSLLVLRVSVSNSAPTFTTAQLAQDYFNMSSFSLARQYSLCSFGAINFQPYDYSNPVMDVMVQGNAASFTKDTLWPLAMAAGAAKKQVSDLTTLAMHIALVLPPGRSDSSDWQSVGTVASWWSIYNDKWGGFPNYAMHELGHNIGMGHAGVGNDEYADESDVMGYDDWQQFGISKCFNGYHFWFLQWFASRSVSVDPNAHNLLTLVAFADYDLVTAANQYVVINVDSYYLVYNRAKGVNSGVNAAINKVTVVQSEPVVFSTRLAALDSTSNVFQVANYKGSSQPLMINVCSNTVGQTVDYAVVSIGVGISYCPGSGAELKTGVPSVAPVVPTVAPIKPTRSPLGPTFKPTNAPRKHPTRFPRKFSPIRT